MVSSMEICSDFDRAYSLLKNRLDLDNEALARIFEDWNTGELDSYLIGITADILRFKDGGRATC